MKLTPCEILQHLGFTVPVDGIDINPHDSFLHVTSLKALGATMNVMAVPKDTLEGMHYGMAGLVSAYRGTEVKPRIDGESFWRLQGTIAALLKVYYKRRSPEFDQALATADESAKPPAPSGQNAHGVEMTNDDLAAAAGVLAHIGEVRPVEYAPPPKTAPRLETWNEVDELRSLLEEVRKHFTRDDDLPNDLLPRITMP